MANIVKKKISINIKLNNGTDSEGNQRTVSVPFGTLSQYNFNADKVLAVIAALEPCLDKSLSSIEMVELSNITAY